MSKHKIELLLEEYELKQKRIERFNYLIIPKANSIQKITNLESSFVEMRLNNPQQIKMINFMFTSKNIILITEQ